MYHASLALVESPVPLAANLQAVVLTGGVPISSTIVSATADGLAPNVDQFDLIIITAQERPLLLNNPVSALPVPNGTKLMLVINDDGISRAITYGNQYFGMVKSLPAVTVAGKTVYLGFMYKDGLWNLLAVVNQQ